MNHLVSYIRVMWSVRARDRHTWEQKV